MRILSVYQTNPLLGSLLYVYGNPKSSVSSADNGICDTSVGICVFGEVLCQREHRDELVFGQCCGSDRTRTCRLHSSACDAILTFSCSSERGADRPGEAYMADGSSRHGAVVRSTVSDGTYMWKAGVLCLCLSPTNRTL